MSLCMLHCSVCRSPLWFCCMFLRVCPYKSTKSRCSIVLHALSFVTHYSMCRCFYRNTAQGDVLASGGLWICTSSIEVYHTHSILSQTHISHIHSYMNIQTKYYLLTLINKSNTQHKDTKEGGLDCLLIA